MYIEQQIDEGLTKGWTPYQIGKEVAKWVERLFEAKVKPKTIMERARRQKLSTNVDTISTPENNTVNGENKEISIIKCEVCNQLYDASKWDTKISGQCPYCWKGYTADGKPRERLPGAGRPPKFRVEEPAHRTQFTGDNEWYTPTDYIEAAREVMGTIDLDPASTEFGQKKVKAKTFYTKENDGLKQEWKGNVWLNPPYAQPFIAQFIHKAMFEWYQNHISQMIILTHNYTDTEWFHEAEFQAKLLCFTKGRIRFEKSDGTLASPTQGQCFFYYGNNHKGFKEVFKQFGFIR